MLGIWGCSARSVRMPDFASSPISNASETQEESCRKLRARKLLNMEAAVGARSQMGSRRRCRSTILRRTGDSFAAGTRLLVKYFETNCERDRGFRIKRRLRNL